MHAVGTRSLQLSPQRGCLVLKNLLRPQALLTEPSDHRPTLSLDAEGKTPVRLSVLAFLSTRPVGSSCYDEGWGRQI